MQAEWIIGIIFLWFLFGLFHYRLVPALDKSKMALIIEFIAKHKRIAIDPNRAPPILNVIPPQSPSSEMPWEEWASIADYIDVGNYFPESKRVVLLEGCRQNIMVHELAHYVQCEYNTMPFAKTKRDEEAWEITRVFFKQFYPVRYWVLTIMSLGVFHWWSSMPY